MITRRPIFNGMHSTGMIRMGYIITYEAVVYVTCVSLCVFVREHSLKYANAMYMKKRRSQSEGIAISLDTKIMKKAASGEENSDDAFSLKSPRANISAPLLVNGHSSNS